MMPGEAHPRLHIFVMVFGGLACISCLKRTNVSDNNCKKQLNWSDPGYCYHKVVFSHINPWKWVWAALPALQAGLRFIASL